MAFNFADRLLTIRSCHRLMCMCVAYVRDQVTSRPGQFVTRLRPRASGAAGRRRLPLRLPRRARRSFAVIWLSSERSGRLYAYHSAALACAWRACGRISQSSRHLMLVPKPRNRKWRLILRTCCPPPAAALRAAYARCARVFSLLFLSFSQCNFTKKMPFFTCFHGNSAAMLSRLATACRRS